jgi:GTPase SAR1 family protein
LFALVYFVLIGDDEESISAEEIRGANGFIFIYDVRNRESFECLNRIRNSILRERQSLKEKRVPIVIVANFSDSQNRVVSSQVRFSSFLPLLDFFFLICIVYFNFYIGRKRIGCSL